ncbi:MAG TPA: signal peptidase I [Bryobacteraceae bacterium]|jgi:signal peptidase I|nr:signal peptidase I [Bryobacteraceae bacterium]
MESVAQHQSDERNEKSTLASVAGWIRDLFISVIMAIFVILFLYQPVKVEGTSMMPALVDQERIFINKFVYKWGLGDIERGDMVVFWFPGDPTKSYIKRVIGLPGDTVEVDNGVVIVNNERLNEAYVTEEYRDRQSMAPFKIQSDEFFVLGDHRSSSNDSRSWGTVPRKFIYGKAVFVYWPLDKMGLLR